MTCRRILLAAPLALLAAAARAQGTITGTVVYRERIALPPGAVLEVELRDTSRADAPAPVVAATHIEVTGQVPIPFALRYDPAAIDPARIYTVAARLSVGGRVRWRSDRVYRVLTGGAGTHAEIRLVAGRAAEPDPARAALQGAPWVAREIAGQPAAAAHRAEITFDPQGRAYGTGGCNRFTGGVTLSGASLRFGAMAQTNMACEEPAMAQEARFHAALAATRSYRIEDAQLLLLDEGGAAVMRLAR